MTSAHGFNHYGSEAPIGREPAGPPQKDGAFERARALLENYEFSDPRIVVGHFDAAAPLLHRVMLLEIKILGLHFLCGVRVGAVRDHADGGRRVFAYRYDTLVGHVETGSEWFILTKELGTGEIRLAIRAAWRPGELPSWWMRLGFKWFSRHYQRAWHRLAYLRLRGFLAAENLPPLPHARVLVQYGSHWPSNIYPPPLVAPLQPPVAMPPVHVVGTGAPPSPITVEKDLVTSGA
ncbi:MAG TPA: DUF1990 family protein [Polyangia bacterium]